MGRLLVFVLALALVAFAAKWALSQKTSGGEPPKAQLDHVRDSARQWEKDAQKKADDAAAKAKGE